MCCKTALSRHQWPKRREAMQKRCRRHSLCYACIRLQCIISICHQSRNAPSCNNTIAVVVKSLETTRRVAGIHLALALPSFILFASLRLLPHYVPHVISPLPHFWMPIDQCAKLAGGEAGGGLLAAPPVRLP